MAQRTITVMTDDIEGKEGDDVQTYTFAVDGVTYEIDLNDKNAAKMRETFDFYASHGRKVGGSRAKRNGSKPKEDLNAIREWARANGHTVSDRGRISQEVREAYSTAQN